MNAQARPWVAIVLYCVSVLSLIVAFVFFMRMQEDQSAITHLREQGVVSRALVVEKKEDKTVVEGRRGRSRTIQYKILQVRHVPKSTVPFADFPAKVAESNLPVAPPPTGDPMGDSEYVGVMFVPASVYDKTKIGDLLTVVNTPWDRSEPVLVSDVNAFKSGEYNLLVGLALVVMVLSGLAGWFVGRKRPQTAG